MVVRQQEDAFNEVPPHLWVVHYWKMDQDGTQYLSHLRRAWTSSGGGRYLGLMLVYF